MKYNLTLKETDGADVSLNYFLGKIYFKYPFITGFIYLSQAFRAGAIPFLECIL